MNKQSIKISLFFIIFLTSFLLGYLSSIYIYNLNDKNINTTQVNEIKESNNILNLLNKKDLDLNLFWRLYEIVNKNYYSVSELNKKELEYGLIDGFVSAIGDKFSEFMDPELTKQFEDSLSGDFEGIGAVIEKHELGIIVDRVLKGSPALNNGILKGDIVIEANGVSLKDLNLIEAVNNIKGPAGTQVLLKIIRSGETDFLEIEIIRDKIKIPSVDHKNLEDEDIGYITLNMFGENTHNEFIEILNEYKNKKGLIIDLRDNGGGYLQTAVEILSNFIQNGKVLVSTKYRDSIYNNEYYSQNNGKIYDKKIVILINGNSASASEIMAGALSDYNKAILVGEKTYGKGSVQQPFSLPDGSLLKLTIAKWYTPGGISIDLNGVSPDIEVNFIKEDYENNYDRQLEVAKEVLKKYIELENISLVIENYEKSIEVLENLKED